ASPRARKRRHAAVKLNSVLRKATPSAKPAINSPPDRGWPSIITSAISSAVASSAARRNGPSMAGTLSGAAAPRVTAAVMGLAHAIGSAPEAERLLEVVPLGAGRHDWTVCGRGPRDHRAVIQARILAAKDLRQHEPVGRGPMARVAVGDDGAGRHTRRERGKLGRRPEAIGAGVIEGRVVEIERVADMPIAEHERRALAAEEEGGRTGVDEGHAAPGLLDVLGLGDEISVDRRGEDFGRRRVDAALDRTRAIGRPGGKSAVEDRNLRQAGDLEGPVDAGGGAEVIRTHARRRHDHVTVVVDPELSNQLLELGDARQYERDAAARDAPSGLVVVAVDGA